MHKERKQQITKPLPIINNNIIIFTLFPVCSRNSYTAVLRLAFYYVKNVQVMGWDSSGLTGNST
jgi:hypothetical protein